MINNKKGKFITFEGCDGSGKSTQLEKFKHYLEEQKSNFLFTREPGGGKISESIRNIILDGNNVEMTDECEALLYAAARVQHLKDKVEPALNKGQIVICDRYVDSSFAYQAWGRNLGYEFIEKINDFALKNFIPDITIFIDLSPEDAFIRKHGADKNDRIEQAGIEFHRKVYSGYKYLANKFPNRIISINGKNSINEIFNEILNSLKERNIL